MNDQDRKNWNQSPDEANDAGHLAKSRNYLQSTVITHVNSSSEESLWGGREGVMAAGISARKKSRSFRVFCPLSNIR
jgi:hypothetical protein